MSKVQYIINVLKQTQPPTPLDELALCHAIKKLLMDIYLCAQDFDRVVSETEILQTVASIFLRDDSRELVDELKSVAMHIVVNLAVGEEVPEIIQPKYGVLAEASRVLSRPSVTSDRLENTLWMLGNVIGHDEEARSRVLSETPVVELILRLSQYAEIDGLVAE